MKQLHIQYKNVDKNYKKKLVLFLARQVHFFWQKKMSPRVALSLYYLKALKKVERMKK